MISVCLSMLCLCVRGKKAQAQQIGTNRKRDRENRDRAINSAFGAPEMTYRCMANAPAHDSKCAVDVHRQVHDQ